MKRRVVVTGLGCVSPLGNTVPDLWQAIQAGQSGARLIDDFDTTQFATHFAATVNGFDASLSLSAKEARRIDLFIQYAVEASRQAILDAGLPGSPESFNDRCGVAIASGIGGLQTMEDNAKKLLDSGPRKISPFFIPGQIINMASGYVSMKYKLRGPNLSMVSACASSAHSLGFSARMIEYGDADMMITGGAEKGSTPLGIGGFNALKALSTRNDDPTKASRPWDKDRDGFVLGDGAAILVLEEYEHAKARGAQIYAEMKGFGMSGDAYHMTAADPDGAGFILSMNHALRTADMVPEEIDYVNAHGTSTPLADPIELAAVKQVFGAHANTLSMSSTKSMTGHLLGAAGGIEALLGCLAIRDQVAPPTINLDNPSEGCDLDLIPHKARSMPIRSVLSNSFGFGGTNSTLIMSHLDA
ncbi:MAG: beta-ketoacyl-[acyl-carrier-protein] synthase II [Coxiellaceae bacterium]|nr:beta-ketoacyl-[acyl-carrier-protein] synthase II [Coxiellaceae bacterium]